MFGASGENKGRRVSDRSINFSHSPEGGMAGAVVGEEGSSQFISIVPKTKSHATCFLSKVKNVWGLSARGYVDLFIGA